jgi:hypothetical protein
MDIGLLISQVGCSAAPASSSALVESGQCIQPAQGETFSALFKGFAQSIPDEEAPSLCESDDPTEPTPSSDAVNQATMASVMEVVLASISAVQDRQVAVSGEADSAESAQNTQRSSQQGIESTPFVLQNVGVAPIDEAGGTGQDSAPTEAALPATRDLPSYPVLQPLADSARSQSGEAAAMMRKQTASQAPDVPLIRKDRGAPVDLAPAPLEQPSGGAPLLRTPPPDSLISDPCPSPVTESQGLEKVLPAASAKGGVQSLDRPSTEIPPSVLIQEQGAQETTLLGQDLLVPMIGESGEEGQDPFEADAHEAGEGTFFLSGENGDPESVTRGHQPSFFNGQFMSARQAQSSPQGEGSSVVTPTGDQLKMTQAFLGEDHSATMTVAPGKAQTVHMELPSHDSGPLSIRISMTDQTVHTQFITDRNDLGAFLMGRQDQLQQSLTKSGLELGQFQVHIDQRGQQEAFPDRQSRRNGGAPEQQAALQDHNQQSQDRERPNHRSPRALSLFA